MSIEIPESHRDWIRDNSFNRTPRRLCICGQPLDAGCGDSRLSEEEMGISPYDFVFFAWRSACMGGNPYWKTKNPVYPLRMLHNDHSPNQFSYQPGVFLIINKQIIPLTKKVTTLGRQLENDIVFHEDFLSRFHAEITYENDKYVLYDKNSTSGTFVNGRRIDRCVLNSGDLISLANIYIMFVNNNPKIAGKATGTTQSLHQGGLSVEAKQNQHE